MARGSSADPAVFFVATLVLWAVSVVFEMAFNGRTELMAVVAGFWFFQAANWAIRLSLSRDPLFVNTAVSLLHSTVTSCAEYDGSSPAYLYLNQVKLERSRYQRKFFVPSAMAILIFAAYG